MSPVTVDVQISDESGKLDPRKLRAVQRMVRDLVSKKKSVLVTVEQGKTGEKYLEHARKYSDDMKEEIRKTNGLLVIAALRAASVPTHTQPFDSEKKAKTFLKDNTGMAAVV